MQKPREHKEVTEKQIENAFSKYRIHEQNNLVAVIDLGNISPQTKIQQKPIILQDKPREGLNLSVEQPLLSEKPEEFKITQKLSLENQEGNQEQIYTSLALTQPTQSSQSDKIQLQIRTVLNGVGNIQSVLDLKRTQLGPVYYLKDKMKILKKRFSWTRSQVDFLSQLMTNFSDYNKWFKQYRADNEHPQPDPSSNPTEKSKSAYLPKPLKKREEKRLSKSNRVPSFSQPPQTIKQIEQVFLPQPEDDPKDQFYKQNFQQFKKLTLRTFIKSRVHCKKLNNKLKIELDKNARLEEQLQKYMEEAISKGQHLASLNDQFEAFKDDFRERERYNLLILEDTTKFRHSSIRDKINPTKYNDRTAATQPKAEIFPWGRRQRNNKCAQYEGFFESEAMWKQLIHDLIEQDEGIKFPAMNADPPYDGTGLDLTFQTMATKQFFEEVPFHLLQDNGYIFLWVVNSQLEVALECLADLGYVRCDILVWVKLNRDKTLNNNIGYYLRHVAEFCIIARKTKKFKGLKDMTVLHYCTNVIIEEVGDVCQKPKKFYEFVEEFIPFYKYLDICARQCNIRDKWYGVGVQSIDMTLSVPILGPPEFYMPWLHKIPPLNLVYNEEDEYPEDL